MVNVWLNHKPGGVAPLPQQIRDRLTVLAPEMMVAVTPAAPPQRDTDAADATAGTTAPALAAGRGPGVELQMGIPDVGSILTICHGSLSFLPPPTRRVPCSFFSLRARVCNLIAIRCCGRFTLSGHSVGGVDDSMTQTLVAKVPGSVR